jgi:light-regulated signal transduction histidine kinase (bacteriophytochrome)
MGARADDATATRIAELTAELAAANREVEAFAAAVSHDLRAPLRAIDSFARALQEDSAAALTDDGRLYLSRILANAERMQEQIADLLTLARLLRGELQRQPVDLSAAAAAVIDTLRRRDVGRTVAVEVAAGLTADADPRLVGILLEALLGNAWKFTGRRVDARITVAAAGDRGTPAFVVSDNGAGFDVASAERLFRPFQRLHHRDDFDGHGIGLATAQRIVVRHGGRIWFDAAPDQGARFWFTLTPGGK